MSNKKDTFKKGFILEGPNNVVIERLEGKNKKKKYLLKISHPLYSLPAITRMSSAQLKHKRAPEYAMDIVKKKTTTNSYKKKGRKVYCYYQKSNDKNGSSKTESKQIKNKKIKNKIKRRRKNA